MAAVELFSHLIQQVNQIISITLIKYIDSCAQKENHCFPLNSGRCWFIAILAKTSPPQGQKRRFALAYKIMHW